MKTKERRLVHCYSISNVDFEQVNTCWATRKKVLQIYDRLYINLTHKFEVHKNDTVSAVFIPNSEHVNTYLESNFQKVSWKSSLKSVAKKIAEKKNTCVRVPFHLRYRHDPKILLKKNSIGELFFEFCEIF